MGSLDIDFLALILAIGTMYAYMKLFNSMR